VLFIQFQLAFADHDAQMVQRYSYDEEGHLLFDGAGFEEIKRKAENVVIFGGVKLFCEDALVDLAEFWVDWVALFVKL